MTSTHSIIYALLLCLSAVDAAQVVPGVKMVTASSLTLPVSPATFKQIWLTWDSVLGASNRVEWGTARYAWTNGSQIVTSNIFAITNGFHYAVKSVFDGIESIPALWPSNRIDRIWVQTSTNLTAWKDGFIWRTNYAMPQEFLRLRQELIQWE